MTSRYAHPQGDWYESVLSAATRIQQTQTEFGSRMTRAEISRLNRLAQRVAPLTRRIGNYRPRTFFFNNEGERRQIHDDVNALLTDANAFYRELELND